MSDSEQPFRSGYVALVGKPNVGKSTLMNAMVGQKLSIVTKKPQTTRHRVIGVLTEPDYQAIFVDTPGIIEPRYALHRAMMKAVRAATTEADVVLFVASATDAEPDFKSLERVGPGPSVLVITRSDLTSREASLPLAEAYLRQRDFAAIVPVSGKTGYQVDRLLNEVVVLLPKGPKYYPDEMISEHPERFFVSEIIREKILELYREEIPYAVQVNIADFRAASPAEVAGAADKSHADKTRIHAEIVVERDSQKAVLIGKGGSALKQVGIRARKDIERFLDEEIFLELFVKVRDDWRNSDRMLRDFGYDP